MTGFGAFGKMPALGDFFRINLPQSFVEPWDAWLQQGIHSVRSELASNWQACFFSAPIWRFTIATGLAGPSAMLGVLMPSIDRVGRQFPLTLAISLPPTSDIPLIHFNATQTFEHLETLALRSLEDGFSRDMLAHRLLNVPTPPSPTAGHQTVNDSTASIISTNPIASLAAETANKRPSAAIWSAELEHSTPMMMTASLPNLAQMRGLFDLEAPIWNVPETEQGAVK